MSEIAPEREIPTDPQGKAELKIAIGAECGLDLRQRIATIGSAPANVMLRQGTLVRIAVRLPNSRGDARNPRDLTCPELREWIAKAVGEEPPGGQFRWVHLKRIYETLQEREVRADGGTERVGDFDYVVPKGKSNPIPEWAEQFEVGDTIRWKTGDVEEVQEAEVVGFSSLYAVAYPVIEAPDHPNGGDHIETCAVTQEEWAGDSR